MTQFSDVKGQPTAWQIMDRLDDFAEEWSFATKHGGTVSIKK